jgi:hypothetical protein
LAQVSWMKTTRVGASLPWCCFRRARRTRTHARAVLDHENQVGCQVMPAGGHVRCLLALEEFGTSSFSAAANKFTSFLRAMEYGQMGLSIYLRVISRGQYFLGDRSRSALVPARRPWGGWVNEPSLGRRQDAARDDRHVMMSRKTPPKLSTVVSNRLRHSVGAAR